MNNLSKVYIFKIFATVFVWCIPLLFFPKELLESLGFPKQDTYMFVSMLGWAYLALCVSYSFGLKLALQNKRAMAPIWTGIVSNGGACLCLIYYGLSGAWVEWEVPIQFLAWSSALATAIILL
jgi:hypothetical protein